MGNILPNKTLELMKKVTQAFGPSGFEKEVADILKEEFEKHNLEIVRDNIGSIFAIKRSKNPNAPKLMICAHMDEVGFLVSDIKANGTVNAVPLGGHTASALGAQRCILKTKDGRYLNGATQIIPPHLGGGEVKVEDVIFDYGFASKEEALANGIYIGAPMIIKGEFEVLTSGRLLSKAFDDRYGIIAIIDILDELDSLDLPYDLYIGGTVQEEVGCRGASTSAYLIKPDMAIVLDCSPSKEDGVLGNGVLIRYFDRSMIAFPELLDYQIKCLEKVNGKYQFFKSPGGTDAGMIHKSLDGILTLTHCLCSQSIHSPSSILDANDYIAARNSLLEMIKNFNKELLLEFKKAR